MAKKTTACGRVHTRVFRQYLISTAARNTGTVLMPGEAPGVFAIQNVTYKLRGHVAAPVFWAREILDREREFLESQVKAETREVTKKRRRS